MNWELVREAPDFVLDHVVEEYEKITDRVGVLERALQLASDAARADALPAGVPEGEDSLEWMDFWIGRAQVELALA